MVLTPSPALPLGHLTLPLSEAFGPKTPVSGPISTQFPPPTRLLCVAWT